MLYSSPETVNLMIANAEPLPPSAPHVVSILGGKAPPPLPLHLVGAPEPVRRADADYAKKVEQSRQELLCDLANGLVPPSFVVSGGSGSGKSHLCTLLKDFGYHQAERMITRPRRPCDPSHDRSFPDRDSHHADPVALSYSKHGAHYAIPMSALTSLSSVEAPRVFIAGDVGKISPFSRALDLALPLMPIVAIRLEVPVAVMADRLSHQRLEGFKGEAELRKRQNDVLHSWEEEQVAALKAFFNIHTILNLTEAEHEKLGYTSTQLKPLGKDLVGTLLPRFELEATARARLLANEIIRKRHVDRPLGVPHELLEVLEEKIAPAVVQSQVNNFAIKGGLAVALYLASDSSSTDTRIASTVDHTRGAIYRPVSLDIDWAVEETPAEIARHHHLIESITGATPAFVDHWGKPIFHSNKAHAVTTAHNGVNVELDAIALSRVKPQGSQFCFEFPLDPYLAFRRREVQLSNGHQLSLVPPEMLLLEKLIAGRNSSMGKYDLFDAVSILCTQPIDVLAIAHIVESQTYKPGSDLGEIPAEPTSWPEVAPALRQCGVKNNALLFALIDRCVVNSGAFRNQNQASSPSDLSDLGQHEGARPRAVVNFEWTPDTLKRMAFLDAALSSLDKCSAELDSESAGEFATIAEAVGIDCVREKIDYLRRFLRYLGSYQVGRPDIYISSETFGVACGTNASQAAAAGNLN